MNRDRLIDYLIAEHHKHCCTCETYKEALQRDSAVMLMYEYIATFGENSQEEKNRLRNEGGEAFCAYIAKKKGHTL